MSAFKNHFNETSLQTIAKAIKKNYIPFKSQSFASNTLPQLKQLELKDRVRLIAHQLTEYLPSDIEASISILTQSLKKNGQDTIGLSGFNVWPLTEFVSQNGLNHFEISLNALEHMTQVFTAEFAIRDFILQNETKVLVYCQKWIKHPNEHVRRLVSEGLRPLLPWGQRLPRFVENPEITWPLLEQLKNDSSEYVRKSVANHINDHSKNHPDLVVKKLLTWKKIFPDNIQITKLIKHASRSLIKNNHADAFILHDIVQKNIEVRFLKFKNKKINLGDTLELTTKIYNPHRIELKLIIDNDLHLLKSNGTYNVKCFKGKTLLIPAKSTIQTTLKIKLIAVTTRKYYTGKQFLTLKVNGRSYNKQAFYLKV